MASGKRKSLSELKKLRENKGDHLRSINVSLFDTLHQ